MVLPSLLHLGHRLDLYARVRGIWVFRRGTVPVLAHARRGQTVVQVLQCKSSFYGRLIGYTINIPTLPPTGVVLAPPFVTRILELLSRHQQGSSRRGVSPTNLEPVFRCTTFESVLKSPARCINPMRVTDILIHSNTVYFVYILFGLYIFQVS